MDDMNCFTSKGTESDPKIKECVPGELLCLDYVIEKTLPKMSENEQARFRRLAAEAMPVIENSTRYEYHMWLEHRNTAIRTRYWRDAEHAMGKYRYSPLHLLWLWSGLKESPNGYGYSIRDTYEEDNNIYCALVINPIVHMLNCDGFRWEYLSLAESAEDLKVLGEIVENGIPTSFLATAKEYGIEPSVMKSFYDKYSTGLIDSAMFRNARDKNKFLECTNLMYSDEAPEFFGMYYDKLPIYVFSAALVLVHFGAPYGNLQKLGKCVNDSDFWLRGLGMHMNILFKSGTVLTKAHYANLFRVLQVLGGDAEYFRFGASPITNVMYAFCKRYKGMPEPVYKDIRVSASWDKKFYFNFLDGKRYAILEGTAPYVWKRVMDAVTSIWNTAMLDMDVAFDVWNSIHSTTFIAIGLDGQAKTYPKDNYSIYSLPELLSNIGQEDALGLIGSLISTGSKVGCYDPYFCFIMMHLSRIDAPLQFWMKVYLRYPLLFDTCLFKAVVAFTTGAKDFSDMLMGTDKALMELYRLSHTIGIGYNRASAAMLRLFLDLHLDIRSLPLSRVMEDGTVFEIGSQRFTVYSDDVITGSVPGELRRLQYKKVSVSVDDDNRLTVKVGDDV